MLLARAIGQSRPFMPSTLNPWTHIIRWPLLPSTNVRFGSMKVKRIQKKQPLEKNRIRRLIKGTRLEVKKPRRTTRVRNTDPNAYVTVKPVDFDPFDLRGRSTLKVCAVCTSY